MKKVWFFIIAIIALIILLFVDPSLLNLVNYIKFPFLNSVFVALLFIEAEPYFEIWLVALTLLMIRKNKKKMIWLVIALIIAAIITTILKHVIARPRPINGPETGSNDSMPSGHATLLFATLPFIETLKNKTVKTIWIILISLLAFARIYERIHYFGDIVFGIIIGYGTSFIVKKWKKIE
jgi:membrane-associated phospholipid phosphatase